MPSTYMKFDGELIEELSNKIPSALFALNELIKNSYDAFSPSVIIEISPANQTISISDKGNGMGPSEIDKLFHISHSSKNYGQVIYKEEIERITQGSKGLGFLAAFKFGDRVEWSTCRNGELSKFSLVKSKLVAEDDLSGIEIEIDTDKSSENG
ncbi:MAG: ATP-binding protein, partial [Kangiellaceae bacterium]|nr:ATP-binding protein [Kangiellaceae bacterium]